MRLAPHLLRTVAVLTAPLFCQAQGIITTVAGGGTASPGDGGKATSALLQPPSTVALDSAGNFYIVESRRIRKVDTNGIITTVAGNLNGTGTTADGQPPTSVRMSPTAVAVDSAGNVYIADLFTQAIRKVDKNGVISTFVGATNGTNPAVRQLLDSPTGLAFDKAGNLYIADNNASVVRKVDTSLKISVVAGTGVRTISGDGGPATSAGLGLTRSVAVDDAGNLYILNDSSPQVVNRVRKVNTAGIISTVVGAGPLGFSGDGGPATNAQLNGTSGMDVDGAGNIYIADHFNYRIRKVDTNGVITTVAGNGIPNFSGDGGLAQNAGFNLPNDVKVDTAGNFYVADTNAFRVRRVAASAGIPIIRSALNGASFNLSQTIIPGSLISLFGQGLASATAQASAIPLPVSLGGVSITIDGIPAPVLFVSSTQVNLQVPWTVQPGNPKMVITVDGVVSAAFTITAGYVSPAIFSTQFGVGQAIAINPDGSLAGPTGSIPGIAARPAKPGETIIILATALGEVSPSIATGAASSDALRNTTITPTVLIGGVAGQLSFSGLSPQFVGVNQLNVVVPKVPAGVVSLQIDTDGFRTSDKVTIAVGNP